MDLQEMLAELAKLPPDERTDFIALAEATALLGLQDKADIARVKLVFAALRGEEG